MWDGYPYHPLRKDFPLQGKQSDLPGIAFTEPAPLAGGPFVTVPTDGTTQVREPRARHAGDLVPPEKFLAAP
jgi:NADH-quinone oxidoreductase subunit C